MITCTYPEKDDYCDFCAPEREAELGPCVGGCPTGAPQGLREARPQEGSYVGLLSCMPCCTSRSLHIICQYSGSFSCSIRSSERSCGVDQGGVTPIDSIVTAATAGQNFDHLFLAF